MDDIGSPVASIVITSRNRKEALLEAIASCLQQTVAVEVLYLDDASEDGSPAAVAKQFPQVRIFGSDIRAGYIKLRNRGAELAGTNFVFSLDDDAVFTTRHVVEQTLRDFDDTRIGAVAIPFKNVRISDELLQRSPSDHGIYVTCTFVGTAHALRRDLFLKLGGYRENLIHQGEESDYCIRMLEAGYLVRLGRADEIHHFVSPQRDMTRLHYYGTRNFLLFFWHNANALNLPLYLAAGTAMALRQAMRVHAVPIKLRAIIDAHREGVASRRSSRPVSARTFRLFRRLSRRPAEMSLILGRLRARPS